MVDDRREVHGRGIRANAATPGMPVGQVSAAPRVAPPIRRVLGRHRRISERVVGEPLVIGALTVRPVVRVSGRRVSRDDVSVAGVAVRLRAEPAGVIFVGRDGRERPLPTPDNTRLVLRGLTAVGLLVAVTSEAVSRALR